jgi:uncharacterized membrane protein YgdD (TMEM256/DUF423 family)|tara:strand:+ start:765 stop:1181 length:417 start_codon:yes stop_codon:yes gene_type:complete
LLEAEKQFLMNVFLILAAVLGTLGLLAGSLGAHLWQDLLTDSDVAGRFQRAEEYLFYHALMLAVVALLVERFPTQKFQSVGWCLAVGVFIFSGSLLVYSVTGFRPIIKITPLGGSLLIIGWILLGIRSWQMYRRHRGR